MDSKDLGKVIKEIRTAKNFSLKDIAGDYLSVSLLSKFERGESEISISRFLYLLNNLDVSIEEFYGILSKESPTHTEKLLEKVSGAFYQNNILALRKYKKEELAKYNTSQKKIFLYYSIMIESFIVSLTDEAIDSKDLQMLTDYLFGVEQWGKSELIILGNSMQAISSETLHLLMKEVLYRTTLFGNSSESKKAKISLLLNAVSTFLDRKELTLAKFYLDILSEITIHETFLYERVEYGILAGTYLIMTGKYETGQKQIEEMLNCLRVLGADNLLVARENNYQKLLDSYNI